MESNYDKLKSYLNAKYEYLAAMGKHNLSEREGAECEYCLLYTSPRPRDYAASRMPSSA